MLLQNDTSSGESNTTVGSAATVPISNPTLLQEADVTFRLLGSGATPFSNTTATVFHQALHYVFSNYSYADFEYQSFTVLSSRHTVTPADQFRCKCD